MKTFKLKALTVFEHENKKIQPRGITFLDGLIVNREDEDNSWLVEAYLSIDDLDYFQELLDADEQLLIQVKITKETNAPASLLTKVIGLNELGGEMNVLFIGSMLSGGAYKAEEVLQNVIDNDHKGTELMEKFKDLL